MQNWNRLSIGGGHAFLAVVFSCCVVRACTIVYPPFTVGTDFRAKVATGGHPVGGLQLMLRLYEPSGLQPTGAIYSITNSEGYARFSNLSPGHFLLTADHDGSSADGADVEVLPDGRKDVIVPLKWPGAKPVGVRSVSGMMRGPDYYPTKIQVPLSLSLLEALSAREIATTLTDPNGNFNFTDQIPPGLYFLRINPSDLRAWSGEQIEGEIAIEVDREARDAALDLDLGWSSCGLGYAQRESYPDIEVNSICGDVTDTSGGVISNAQVMVMTSGEDAVIIGKTASDMSGHFRVEAHWGGTYQLVIKSSGFQPFLRVVHVTSAESSQGCEKPIRVRLNAIM